MSKEAVAAFLKKVADDAKLQQELVLFAAEHGYEFTVDELEDSELDQVAGGVLTAPPKDLSMPIKMPIVSGSGGEDR